MSTTEEQRRNRSGCVVAIVITLVAVLALAFLADLAVSSFLCVNSQGDNLRCAAEVVAGHFQFYVAAIGVIALIAYVLRRITR